MKILLASFAGLLLAGSVAAQAAVITFDSQADFDNYFTREYGSFSYAPTRDGLYFTGTQTSLLRLGNTGYDPGKFETESISATFKMNSFNATPSLGIGVRMGDQAEFSLITGLSALVNINSSSQVKFRIGTGLVYAGASYIYDVNFNGLTLSASTTFNFEVQQRTIELEGVEQASLRLILSDANSDTVYADSNWITHANFANFTDPGRVGMRIYSNGATNGYTVHSFSPMHAVPEPSTYVLFGSALLLGGWAVRRQKLRRM